MILEVGSGLGKPTFAFAHELHPFLAFGVESELERWQLSVHNHRRIYEESITPGSHISCNGVWFIRSNILAANTFDPFTHIYQFDIGIPPDLFFEMAKKFNDR